MGKIIVSGTLAPVKQSSEISYDPQRGEHLVERWESAGRNLGSIAAGYQALRTAYNFTDSPHKSVIVATLSGPSGGQPEVTTDTWQILANEIQKDLFEHPTAAALGTDVLTAIAAAIDDKKTLAQAGFTGNSRTVFELKRNGTTHYALGQYVLRHTTNVSAGYSVNVADFNVERIYTTAQLLAEATNTNSWVYPLPGRLVHKIENLPAPTARSGYLWGWRKLPSTETTSSGNRIEITTEYWLEQWSTFIYGVVA